MLRRFDQDGVAVLVIDNPPINAINVAVRAALDQMLDRIERDPAIVGVVIAAEGRLFSGGGDLREIGQAAPPGGPTMTELAHRIETWRKPVVVAIRGRAIGGGILLSMACHARLGAPDASIALPEVRLGFVPGAGGTQRLPRLVGIEPALEMIALAKALDAPTAHRAGFFDAISEADRLVDTAIAHVRAIAAGDVPWRRTASLPVPVDEKDDLQRIAERYGQSATEAFPDRHAPQAAIALVLGAVDRAFADGLSHEREVFERLSNSIETRALLHLFFAERALGRGGPIDPTSSSPGSVRLVTSSCRPRCRIVEIVCTGAVTVEQLAAARDEAKARRLVPVVVTGGSIIERLNAARRDAADAFRLQAVVDEARACLAAGMAASAGDIDVLAVEACGFPATRGGPLFYADTIEGQSHGH